MQQPKITSGLSEVLASGLVICFEKNPVVLEVANLKFVFVFLDEEGKEEPGVKFETPSGNELKIILSNFKNPLGAGNSKPYAIGNINGRHLYLSYRIYDLVGGDKTLHYTFYLGGLIK